MPICGMRGLSPGGHRASVAAVCPVLHESEGAAEHQREREERDAEERRRAAVCACACRRARGVSTWYVSGGAGATEQVDGTDRTPQTKPALPLKSWLSMIGKMSPPTAEPGMVKHELRNQGELYMELEYAIRTGDDDAHGEREMAARASSSKAAGRKLSKRR